MGPRTERAGVGSPLTGGSGCYKYLHCSVFWTASSVQPIRTLFSLISKFNFSVSFDCSLHFLLVLHSPLSLLHHPQDHLLLLDYYWSDLSGDDGGNRNKLSTVRVSSLIRNLYISTTKHILRNQFNLLSSVSKKKIFYFNFKNLDLNYSEIFYTRQEKNQILWIFYNSQINLYEILSSIL